MHRVIEVTNPFADQACPDLSIDRLIQAHWGVVAPFLSWDEEMAAQALLLLDEEVDAYVAEVDPTCAGMVGHEIARLLVRAVLTMRAGQTPWWSPVSTIDIARLQCA